MSDVDEELCDAACYGREGELKGMLKAGRSADATSGGTPAIQMAVWEGQLGTMRILLAAGADTEKRHPNGDTALTYAAYKGDVKLVRELLAHGANRAAKGDKGLTAAEWAKKEGNSAVLELLSNPPPAQSTQAAAAGGGAAGGGAKAAAEKAAAQKAAAEKAAAQKAAAEQAAAEQAAAEEAEPPYAAELAGLSFNMLKRRAKALGATDAQLEDLDDEDDLMAAAVALTLSLRHALDGMKMKALKARLRAIGATEQQIEDLGNGTSPRAAAIALVLDIASAGPGGAAAPPQAPAAAEPEPQPEPLEITLDKYVAADKQIRLGKLADAAHGIKVLLGVSDAAVSIYLQQHEEAIKQEFAAHGTPEDKANLRCILSGTKIPGWACPGVSVDLLLAHSSARTAKLGRHHIIALRIYTTSSYSRINDPLRADPPQRPHPFAATTYFISDGIRLLRAVAASQPDAYIERILWRGMKDLGITGQFLTEGGTDYACVSTTASQEVAVLNFAASSLPLVFRIVTKNSINRGADISFLSVFPHEQEFLYPPLTYLHCVKMERETLCGVQMLVATVEPTMA
eukprot:COSAG02_NODE_505_length_20935_cov_38.509119_12_plen_571_part_00